MSEFTAQSQANPKSNQRRRAFQLIDDEEPASFGALGPRNAARTSYVKTVFAIIPRGNRKTTLGAALTLYTASGP